VVAVQFGDDGAGAVGIAELLFQDQVRAQGGGGEKQGKQAGGKSSHLTYVFL
jgi:hypothetical protein